jgi:hypothetical protein
VATDSNRLRQLADLTAGPGRSPQSSQPVTGRLSCMSAGQRTLPVLAARGNGFGAPVCLTNMVIGTGTIDPWQAYQFLRTESPAQFGA